MAIAKEQGLQLDLVYAEKDNKENHAKLRQINPLGQVPVFVGADGYVLTECIAIALYSMLFPSSPFSRKTVGSPPPRLTGAQKNTVTSQSETTTLLGSSRRDYYNILRWMSLANSDLLPAIGGVIFPLIGRTAEVRKNGDDCLRAFHTDCKLLDTHLQQNKYLIGDHLTLADLFTVGLLQFAVMTGHKVLKEEYPRLTEWFHQVYEIPMFKAVAGDLHLLDVPFPTLPQAEKAGGG